MSIQYVLADKSNTRKRIIKELSDKPSYPTELADKLGISRGRASYVIRCLELNELVKLKDIKGSRWFYDLTRKGKRLYRKHENIFQTYHFYL
jgi:DNA-binding MarR family transcriptional regulator